MWQRLRNIWRPENFHYAHQLSRGRGQFEGWYIKLVDREGRQPFALIPGVFLGEDRHAFIQILDGHAGSARYHRFPLGSFEAAQDRFDVTIAGSRFTTAGVWLDIDAETSSPPQVAHGEVGFGRWRPWPVTALSPGTMGPYGFAPFMECNHGILSLDHGLTGSLRVDGRPTDFTGGRGYVEKDWGRSFPEAYVWTHSNHFDRPGISLTAAVAIIPWLTGAFRGHIIGFLLDGQLHRFTTYTGGRLEVLSVSDHDLRVQVCNRTHRLEITSHKQGGALLHAPYDRQMIERVAETMTSELEVRFSRIDDGRRVFEGRGIHACLEAQGKLAKLLESAPRGTGTFVE